MGLTLARTWIVGVLRRLPSFRGEITADALALVGIACLAVAGFEVYSPAGWVVLGVAALALSFGAQRKVAR